jgi:hypothetical protein
MRTSVCSKAVRKLLPGSVVWLALLGHAHAAKYDDFDVEAKSGEPERILQSIKSYQSLNVSHDIDVLWRLLRAYFNYYDEYTERDRDMQRWAAEQGWELANAAWNEFPDKAVVAIAYKDIHRIQGPGLKKIRRALEDARRMNPKIDDGGPDRRLGLSYLLPWPFKNKEKALYHMQEAVRLDCKRAANRLGLARALAEVKRFDEGWTHIQAVRTGKLEVSSEHWKMLYRHRVEVVAAEFPQDRQQADRTVLAASQDLICEEHT